MIWFTSDQHFGDTRIDFFVRNSKTPEQNIEELIENYNKLVAPSDTVYVIGDVTWKGIKDEDKFQDHIKRLNGSKHLILGNHDKLSIEVYKECFESINYAYKLIHNDCQYYLVHHPKDGRKDMFNLVGHVHGCWRIQRNMINVGVDVWNFRPVSINQIEKERMKIAKVFDENIFAGELECNKI